MSSVADQLDQIVQKTDRLIALCTAFQEENTLLREENRQVKQAFEQARMNVAELNEKIRVLKLAKSIEGTSEKTLDIKQKINEFVREIDKCVVLLKK